MSHRDALSLLENSSFWGQAQWSHFNIWKSAGQTGIGAQGAVTGRLLFCHFPGLQASSTKTKPIHLFSLMFCCISSNCFLAPNYVNLQNIDRPRTRLFLISGNCAINSNYRKQLSMPWFGLLHNSSKA